MLLLKSTIVMWDMYVSTKWLVSTIVRSTEVQGWCCKKIPKCRGPFMVEISVEQASCVLFRGVFRTGIDVDQLNRDEWAAYLLVNACPIRCQLQVWEGEVCRLAERRFHPAFAPFRVCDGLFTCCDV
jgi:hypothetical protein